MYIGFFWRHQIWPPYDPSIGQRLWKLALDLRICLESRFTGQNIISVDSGRNIRRGKRCTIVQSRREVDCEVCRCKVRICNWLRHLGTKKHREEVGEIWVARARGQRGEAELYPLHYNYCSTIAGNVCFFPSEDFSADLAFCVFTKRLGGPCEVMADLADAEQVEKEAGLAKLAVIPWSHRCLSATRSC